MQAKAAVTTGALLIATLFCSRGADRGVAAAAAGSGCGTNPTMMPAQTAAAKIAESPLSILILTQRRLFAEPLAAGSMAI